MSNENMIDQIINDLYTSKLTRSDISKKYQISETDVSLILKSISQDPEILSKHHIFMLEKSGKNKNRGHSQNLHFLSPIPLEIQLYDPTLGISLLNFKELFLKYHSYLNFSTEECDFDYALENSSKYLGYNQTQFKNQISNRVKVIMSNISPFFYLDDFEAIEKVAYKIQEADQFLARYFIRQEYSVIKTCTEFYNQMEYSLRSISNKEDFPIFELQTGIKYLSWANRYFKNNKKYENIYLKVLEISEKLFILLFIPSDHRDSLLEKQKKNIEKPPGDFVKNLKFLGVESNNAIILDELIYNKEVPISKFKANSSQKKGNIVKSLNKLIEKGVVISYNKKNSYNRIFKYYSLNKSPKKIYDYIELKNKNKSRNLFNIFNSTNWDYFNRKDANKIVKKITNIGISNDVAKILVYLHLNPKQPSKVIKDSCIINDILFTNLIRELYDANWIKAEEIGHVVGHSNKRYSLSEPLCDIVLKYLINYLEQIDQSLAEIKGEFSKLEKYVPINLDCTTKSPEKIQEMGYKLIIENLKPILLSHSNIQNQSFVLELKPPLPNLVRIYLADMRISLSKDAYVARLIFGNKKGEVWNFDKKNVLYTVLCGYINELNMFILFDTSFHTNISYQKKISIPTSLVYEAMRYEQIFKRITNNKELVIIVPPTKLLQGLDQRYELHLQNLISGNFN